MEIKIPRKNRPQFTFSVSVALIGAVLSLLRLDGVWFVVSFIYLALIYGISPMKEEDQIQRDLYKWTTIPLFFGVTGASGVLSTQWLFGDLAFAIFMPILAFMTLLNLSYHTKFQTNLHFSTSFIFLFTLAAGALLKIAQYLSVIYLEATLLENNEQLMLELLFISFIGLIGSYFFKTYREIYYMKWKDFSILNRMRSKLEVTSENPREDFLEMLYTFFGRKEDNRLILISKFLQIGIILVAIYSVLTLNIRVIGLTIPSFGASMIPYLYSQNLQNKVPAYFKLWISLSLFLYVSGEAIGLQSRLDWWNNFTHFLGGMIIGLLILIFLIYLNQVSNNLYLPDWLLPLLVLMFMLSVSVVWELFEFTIDSFSPTTLQIGIDDTATDLIVNSLGAFFVMMLTSYFTPYDVFEPIKDKLNIS